VTSVSEVESPPRQGPGRRLSTFFFRHSRLRLGGLLAAPLGWLVVVYLGSLFLLLLASFWDTEPFTSDLVRSWNLDNYRRLFEEPVYRDVAVRTISMAVFVTLADAVLAFPLAYYMAQVAQPAKLRALLLLLIVPYWVNEILRAFAFLILFGTGGTLNAILIGLGLIDAPIDFIGANVALYAGLTYAYLLLMIFPLYNAIESLDRNQIEAARDLGAPWWHIHLNVVMPFAKPGIASGCTLVFMLVAGSLAAPLVLGGPKTLWFTPIVYDRFYQAFNWQQGSAYAIILLLTCIAFVMMVMRIFKVSLSEITR